MTNVKNNSIKVLFVQKISEGEFETEAIWCEKNGMTAIIDNIPFIAKRISLGDSIAIEFDEEDNQYYFDDFIATSGNTTVRIYIYNNGEIKDVRNWLKKSHCESEVLASRGIIAVNIPKNVDYIPIKTYLDKGEEEGKWTYEESCLEHSY